MRSVGTLIFERPRPLSRQRRANHLYTLNCEEPDNLLTAFSVHGPFVLIQLAASTDGLDSAASLIAKTLDLQAPLIDRFSPTHPDSLKSLPVDPTGLLARTVPVSADDYSPQQRAVYEVRGVLHFQSDPERSTTVFRDAGVIHVAIAETRVYETRDVRGAKAIAEAFYGDARLYGTPAPPAEDVPNSRCVSFTGGNSGSNYCVATVDQYAFEAEGAPGNAQQKLTAQYALLKTR